MLLIKCPPGFSQHAFIFFDDNFHTFMLIAPETPGKQDVAYSIPFYKELKSE